MLFGIDEFRIYILFDVLIEAHSLVFDPVHPAAVDEVGPIKFLLGLFYGIQKVFPHSFQRQRESYRASHDGRIVGEKSE
jgi:hypothetical protein